MYENEKQFVESIVNFKSNIQQAQQYIKETYNVESEYNEDENILYIKTENINESLNAAVAKEYIDNKIGENFVTVKFK